MQRDPNAGPAIPQKIVGFHQDEEQHWVADLECGHTQHVRHDPPWQVRTWVTTPEGRASRVGTTLECVKCVTGPRVERAPVRQQSDKRDPPRWLRAFLGVPLRTKIIGANLSIVVIAVVLSLLLHDWSTTEPPLAGIMLLALILSIVVNVVLVHIALHPIHALELTAERVWRGDLDARVAPSMIADRDMARVGRTVNLLLDGLTSDRARMRQLAAQVIRAQDEERARIARELHDSAAQMLTALVLQLSAAARDSTDPELSAQLSETQTIASEVLEEVRLLAHTVHPRVLDDLGLGPALHHLARQGAAHASVNVAADTDAAIAPVPDQVASALYRVAQEAMRNALRHGQPENVSLTLTTTSTQARLEVSDDGCGFDQEQAMKRRPGMGLFTMRERMSLVDGTMEVKSEAGRGTSVVATVQLQPVVSTNAPMTEEATNAR